MSKKPWYNVPGFFVIFVIRYVFFWSTDWAESPGCYSPGFLLYLLYEKD